MTDFSTLSSDIATWSARDDLSTHIPTFIMLAEARINRELRVMEMETATTLDCTSASSYTADLPSNYLGFKSVINASSGKPRCVYLPPEKFHIQNNLPNDAFAVPTSETSYTIEANKIKIVAASGASDTVTLNVVYFKRLDALSLSNTTNDILTAHYDLYLYGALEALWGFVDELEDEAKWASKFSKVIAAIDDTEKNRRLPSGSKVSRPPARRIV